MNVIATHNQSIYIHRVQLKREFGLLLRRLTLVIFNLKILKNYITKLCRYTSGLLFLVFNYLHSLHDLCINYGTSEIFPNKKRSIWMHNKQ